MWGQIGRSKNTAGATGFKKHHLSHFSLKLRLKIIIKITFSAIHSLMAVNRTAILKGNRRDIISRYSQNDFVSLPTKKCSVHHFYGSFIWTVGDRTITNESRKMHFKTVRWIHIFMNETNTWCVGAWWQNLCCNHRGQFYMSGVLSSMQILCKSLKFCGWRSATRTFSSLYRFPKKIQKNVKWEGVSKPVTHIYTYIVFDTVRQEPCTRQPWCVLHCSCLGAASEDNEHRVNDAFVYLLTESRLSPPTSSPWTWAAFKSVSW